VVDTAAGPVTPVGIEQRVEAVDRIASAAVVGVGPAGTQRVVVVVVAEPGIVARRPGARCWPSLAHECGPRGRRGLGGGGAGRRRPTVDIRHAAKIDRTRVATWAARVLAGEALAGACAAGLTARVHIAVRRCTAPAVCTNMARCAPAGMGRRARPPRLPGVR
jgi:hypothetical protein